MPCNCDKANLYKSGGESMDIKEFTASYETLYEYKNWDEEGVYKCLICSTLWYIKSENTDRPPFTCWAERITKADFNKLMRVKERHKEQDKPDSSGL